jgi:hypothetical protein
LGRGDFCCAIISSSTELVGVMSADYNGAEGSLEIVEERKCFQREVFGV